ncbi:Endoglucanase [Thalictrum thalictroides]|uniref:Endoglucanase n=1 Tax=Thalictrum thalictroides TaxID=46969 RepID=A0A7J6WW11_THATH|nr:Endoglucanase [Thalictrum thalictroides]
MSDDSLPFMHTPSSCRVIPSSSQWNSIELDFNLLPPSSRYDDIPTKYSQSYHFNLTITNRRVFNRFIYILVSIVLLIIAVVLLACLLPPKHTHPGSSRNYTIPVNQALSFFDAQKSGIWPKNNAVKFRGDSGVHDGNSSNTNVNLVGGYYDSGNNIKFTFPTAYTVTLLSWTVIEYHEKYSNVGEIDHVKDIIKWGSDYLLKVGSTDNSTTPDNDINCWQRPEDMAYQRPVSFCKDTASDLAGEIIAALSAASLVFQSDQFYSEELIKAAEQLFGLVTSNTYKNGTYTIGDCGREAGQFYNSSGYLDELTWGGSWLFFATGNTSYLHFATDSFGSAMNAELDSDKGVFYWNNKLAANAVLLTRLRFFHDPGYPYEVALESSENITTMLMCSYLSGWTFDTTPGGLILLRPDYGAPLQYAATASFLSKLYTDYLYAQRIPGVSCGTNSISPEMLQTFSMSQVNYILGQNPKKMSYLVGYSDNYPKQVHHRAASIPWDNQQHSCVEGDKWLSSKDPNPNVLIGGMVGGPDKDDNFIDSRENPVFTEPTISGNAGLVAALIALHEPSHESFPIKGIDVGVDPNGIFANIKLF